MITEPQLRSSIQPMAWPAVLSGTAAEIMALQHQFDATQWWPPARLRVHQFQQLQRLLLHAARTVPFHAERISPPASTRWHR